MIGNRIFEIKAANYFISKNQENPNKIKITGVLAEDVIHGGCFNMELTLYKFCEHYR